MGDSVCLTRPFKFNESDVLLGLESKRVRGLHEDSKHVTSNLVRDPHYRPLSCNSWSYRLRPVTGRSRAWVKVIICHSIETLEQLVLIMIMWHFPDLSFSFFETSLRCSDVQTVVFPPLILSSILRLHPNRTFRGVAFSVSARFPFQQGEWHMPFYLFCFPLQLLTKREVYIIPHNQILYIFTLTLDNAQ